MTRVARLLTLVDLNDGHDEGPEARRLDVSARLEAVLADGRRVVLLDDRGWSELGHIDFDHEPTPEERARELSRIRIWDHQTVEGMAETARVVVDPTTTRTPTSRPTGARWPTTSAGRASRWPPPSWRRCLTTSSSATACSRASEASSTNVCLGGRGDGNVCSHDRSQDQRRTQRTEGP
jgi:hypothetical protein